MIVIIYLPVYLSYLLAHQQETDVCPGVSGCWNWTFTISSNSYSTIQGLMMQISDVGNASFQWVNLFDSAHQ